MIATGKRAVTVVAAAVVMLAAGAADAQWVMLARRVVGKVETISQQSKDGATAYVTAAVILDVPADKVYAAVKSHLQAARDAQGVAINRADDARYTIEFYRGELDATIQVSSLGDNLTQMMVSSVQSASATGPTLTQTIVDRILAVCKQMNVECSSVSH